MTTRPGADWGERGDVPAGAEVVRSDRAAAALVAAGVTRPVVLRGGDLYRTVGSPRPGPRVTRLPVDVLRVRADGRDLVAVAHVVARGGGPLGWWRGPVVAVMNAEHLGRWDVAPRAHPNDGRFDTVVVASSMPARARWQAWRRLPAGDHLPHPAITVGRGSQGRWTFDPPLTLFADGRRVGRVRDLVVRLEPDALTVHV